VFDQKLQPILRTVYESPARQLLSRGVSADALTLVGFAIGLAGVGCLAVGAYQPALALVLLNRIADGLDGAVARLAGPTDRGAFLDSTLDFVFYAAVPFGFALADPVANALPAAALLLGFMGAGTSFLAFAAVAGRRGLRSDSFPHKGIYYLGGLTEGGETIAFFVLMCLWPAWFPALAWLFAALCLVTAVTRWVWGWRAFSVAK
jgi:phosphatidylglycerophosphate synthase